MLGIDTILSEQGMYSSMSVLNSEGYNKTKFVYCDNGNILLQYAYSDDGITTCTKKFKCDEAGVLLSETISSHKKDKFLKTVIQNDKKQPLSNTAFDKKGQIKTIKYYDKKGKLSHSQDYIYDKNNRFKTVINRNSKNNIVLKEITELDKNGKEKSSSVFENEIKKTTIEFEYDEFENLKRKIELGYPDKKMKNESLYFYSTAYKLDSTKQYFGAYPEKYTSTVLFYDDKGLKKKEVRTDRRNQKVAVTHFRYQ
ncbi:MAG: hypothetical protein HRT72_04675 [Flavobacteriales bacterium]|nr:hypothetical protein [Flavobacteriales bacterium]